MKLTDQQVRMFKSLMGTPLGDEVRDYLESFCDWMCDIRNMDNLSEEARKARLDMAKLLDTEMIARLRLHNPAEAKSINPFV